VNIVFKAWTMGWYTAIVASMVINLLINNAEEFSVLGVVLMLFVVFAIYRAGYGFLINAIVKELKKADEKEEAK
jgi:Tfp pilus assembly protein PilO